MTILFQGVHSNGLVVKGHPLKWKSSHGNGYIYGNFFFFFFAFFASLA